MTRRNFPNLPQPPLLKYFPLKFVFLKYNNYICITINLKEDEYITNNTNSNK